MAFGGSALRLGYPFRLCRQVKLICEKSITSSYHVNPKLHVPVTVADRGMSTSGALLSGNADISRYPIPNRDSLPQDVQQLMNETEEKGGFLPNVFKALSYRPEEFRAFFNYYDVLMGEKGNLTKADKEMIVVATSAKNSCLYCIVAHGALFRIYSKNPLLADQVAANWRTADLDQRQRAILEFAMDIASCEPPSDERFKNLEQHGLNSDDAWDIGAIAAFFAMSNRLTFLTNTKPNTEFYLLGRMPRQKTT